MSDYAGKSKKQVRSIKQFRARQEESRDFCRPHFDKGLDMWNLYSGVLPPELESTYSQIMLWFAYAIVDQELTTAMRSMLTNPDWLTLEATEPKFERTSKIARKWLTYQMEKVQQFQRYGIAPIQSAYIFGKGYRWYKYAQNTKMRQVRTPNIGLMGMQDPENPFTITEEPVTSGIISATSLNFFNGFPSPNGHEINTPEHLSEERLDYFIANCYPTKKWIESLVESGHFDKGEAGRLFEKKKHGSEGGSDPSSEWKQKVLEAKGGWSNFSAPSWMTSTSREVDNDNANPRYRVGYDFSPDKWRIVAEDNFVLYDGPPLLNRTPIASFDCNTGQSEFFKKGVIEPVEDLIITMNMNINLRMDHLITKFHPTKYLPQELVDAVGGDLRRFDTKPFNYIPYEHTRFKQGMKGLITTESGDELGQQAFLEQGQMKEYLEDIISQKGTGGYANQGSGLGGAMINQDMARSMLRAMNVDITGIRESADITLAFGGKYIQEDELVRTGEAGVPWENIDFDAITDGYGITINGARKLAMQEEIFKKMLTTAPMLAQDPQIKGQVELKRQLLNASGYDNVETILSGDDSGPQSPAEALQVQPKQNAAMPGGVPSFTNDIQSEQANSPAGLGLAGI